MSASPEKPADTVSQEAAPKESMPEPPPMPEYAKPMDEPAAVLEQAGAEAVADAEAKGESPAVPHAPADKAKEAGEEQANNVREERRRSRSPSRKDKDKERKHLSRSRSRDRSRSRKDKKRSSRSRSRDKRRRSRSPRDRDRSHRRSRSRDRKERRRSRSRSRDRRRRSPSPEVGGYVPRSRRGGEEGAAPTVPGTTYGGPPPVPAASVVPPQQQQQALQQLLQQQQLRAQQLILQQQLMSAQTHTNTQNSAREAKQQRAARRVYVGNLQPHMVTEEQLRAIFNSALMAVFPGSSVPGMEPVVSINRHTEGRYAFIELRTPEMATAALQLSGQVTLHGRAMSVERPQDYVDPNKQVQAQQMASMAMSVIAPGASSMSLPGPPPMPGGMHGGMQLPGPPPGPPM